MLSTEKFCSEVDTLVKKHNLSYIDDVVHYCEKNNIEIEVAASIVKSNFRIKSLVQSEGEELNFLAKTAKLPLWGFMTPFEAYKLYLALRMHFTQPKFDYFKYNGKVNADINSFNTRRDKFQFAKLAKHRDPQSLIVSNYLTATPKWVGDFLTDESEQHFTDWQRRKESLSYIVSQDLKKLEDDFISFAKMLRIFSNLHYFFS